MKTLLFRMHALIFFLMVMLIRNSAQSALLPTLQKGVGVEQLIVDGNPFLMLAGELGNSSASDPDYMRPFWPLLHKMNLNTVLVPVYWELMEPEEGVFNFSLVDSAIFSARKYDLKIVFLWFGSWKNSMSCYAPLWVKNDIKRFERARRSDGTAVEILTPFSNNNLDADKRAFVQLMKHIKKIDSDKNTVIMIQVENEIGMIPEARDHCDLANKSFSEQVPPALINRLETLKDKVTPELYEAWNAHGHKKTGNWEEIFGKGLHTDEFFMAWYFAQYTNEVAKAGKAEYSLPMYVNAALIRSGYKPGQYPSAGPLPHLIDIWKTAAPSIDFLSPDIYFKEFALWVERYDIPGNAMFIPEVGNDQSMAQAFYAFANHDALGYSPFSIVSLAGTEPNAVTGAYDILSQLTPLILSNQGKGTMKGFLLDSTSQKLELRLGNFLFTIKHEYSWPYISKREAIPPRVGGLIIMLSENDFLVAGTGVVVTFTSAKNDGTIAGIGSIDEGKFEGNKWIPGLRLNGDQNHQGRHMHISGEKYSMQRVILYEYK